jgi:hypothetical protein
VTEIEACLRKPFTVSFEEDDRLLALGALVGIEHPASSYGDEELEAFEHVPEWSQVEAAREARRQAKERAHGAAMAALERDGWLLGEVDVPTDCFLGGVTRGPGSGFIAVASARGVPMDLGAERTQTLVAFDARSGMPKPVAGASERPANVGSRIDEIGQEIDLPADPVTKRQDSVVVTDLATGEVRLRHGGVEPSMLRGQLSAGAVDPSRRWLVLSFQAGAQSGLRVFDLSAGGQARSIVRSRGEGFMPPGVVTLARRQARGLSAGEIREKIGRLLEQIAGVLGRKPNEVMDRAVVPGQLETVLSELEAALAAGFRRADPMVHALAFTPDGSRLCAGTSDGFAVYQWGSVLDCGTSWPTPEFSLRTPDVESPNSIPGEEPGHIYSVALDPGAPLVLFGGITGTLHGWDATSGTTRAVLTLPEASILRLAFSADGSGLAVVFRRKVRLEENLEEQDPQRLIVLRTAKVRAAFAS